MLVKLIAILLLAALLLPMLGGIRRIRDLPGPDADRRSPDGAETEANDRDDNRPG